MRSLSSAWACGATWEQTENKKELVTLYKSSIIAFHLPSVLSRHRTSMHIFHSSVPIWVDWFFHSWDMLPLWIRCSSPTLECKRLTSGWIEVLTKTNNNNNRLPQLGNLQCECLQLTQKGHHRGCVFPLGIEHRTLCLRGRRAIYLCYYVWTLRVFLSSEKNIFVRNKIREL